MKQSSKFWDRLAKTYSKQTISDESTYQQKLQITRGYLRPDTEVFEFGCGTGSTAIIHAPHVKHILATDISPKMLEIARDKADTQNISNITFRQSTIEEFTTPDNSFDVVLGLSILHLLENKDDVIAKVFELLQPGGLFISSTTCMGDTMKYIKYIAPLGRWLGLLPLVSIFTAADLKNSLLSAGFEIEHELQPAKNKAIFFVARKAGSSANVNT